MNISSIVVPEFHEFSLTPRNSACHPIDPIRLVLEILWGAEHAANEFSNSAFASKLTIEGSKAVALRYRREKDNVPHPACVLSFEPHESGYQVVQIQWSKDKHTAFRVWSSFNSPGFFLRLIEESFLKKWIPVTALKFPTGIEWVAYWSSAISRYEIFRTALFGLNTKYNLGSSSNDVE